MMNQWNFHRAQLHSHQLLLLELLPLAKVSRLILGRRKIFEPMEPFIWRPIQKEKKNRIRNSWSQSVLSNCSHTHKHTNIWITIRREKSLSKTHSKLKTRRLDTHAIWRGKMNNNKNNRRQWNSKRILCECLMLKWSQKYAQWKTKEKKIWIFDWTVMQKRWRRRRRKIASFFFLQKKKKNNNIKMRNWMKLWNEHMRRASTESRKKSTPHRTQYLWLPSIYVYGRTWLCFNVHALLISKHELFFVDCTFIIGVRSIVKAERSERAEEK